MKKMNAPEKITQKMTRDGAVTENHVTGERTDISRREPERELIHSKHESIQNPVTTEQRKANRESQRRCEAAESRAAPRLRPQPLVRCLHTGSPDDEDEAEADIVAVEAGGKGVEQLRSASAAAQRRQIKRRYASRWWRAAAQGQAGGWKGIAARAKRAVRKATVYVQRLAKPRCYRHSRRRYKPQMQTQTCRIKPCWMPCVTTTPSFTPMSNSRLPVRRRTRRQR